MYRPQAVSKTSGTVFPNTDLPSGEEHIDIFSRSTKAIVFIIHVYEQLTVCSVGCFLLSVLWYDLKNRKRVSFPCNSHKTLSHLELNFKRRLIVLDVRFKNWGISLRWCSRISTSFSWGLLDHVLRLYQSRPSKNIWWIITKDVNDPCGLIRHIFNAKKNPPVWR